MNKKTQFQNLLVATLFINGVLSGTLSGASSTLLLGSDVDVSGLTSQVLELLCSTGASSSKEIAEVCSAATNNALLYSTLTGLVQGVIVTIMVKNILLGAASYFAGWGLGLIMTYFI